MNILFVFISLICAGIFTVGCAKKDVDKEDYSAYFRHQTGVCAEIAFREFRDIKTEADRLAALNLVQKADMKYREAYNIYFQNELDYINLQGRISNARIMLTQQKHKLNTAEDSADKIMASTLLKNAERMINMCNPLEAVNFINKSHDLLK